MADTSAVLFLENQLCFPLYAASRLTIQAYTPLLNELDITYPQYLVLLVMWQHGEQSVNEIGQKLYLESNTVTPLLKRLEQKGLLERQRSDRDERSVLISLTANGLQMKEHALSIPSQILGCFQDDQISMEEVRQFQQSLFKLLGVLKAKNAG